MLSISENEFSNNHVKCTACVILNNTYQNFPKMQGNFRLIFVKNGVCDIMASDSLFSLRKNEFIFLDNKVKPSYPMISGDNPSVWLLDFSMDDTEFSKFELNTNKVYSSYKINLSEQLSKISWELTENSVYGTEFALSQRISLLLTDISKSLYSITLPDSVIGKNGFSVKNVGERILGYFHGRSCIKIKANTKINSILVLENYDIYDYKIDLKELKYVQLNYYYDCKSYIQPPFARIRFLSFKDENGNMHIYEKEKHGHPEFFAPLTAGKWTSAIFPIKLVGVYLSLTEPHRNAHIVQMKLDPFGVRQSTEIGEDEAIYISSVTFYKKLPQNKDLEISYDPRINSVLELMNQNLSKNYDLKFYADKFYLSPSYFSEWFKNETGISPHRYILIKKIKFAKSKLANTNMPIKNIAENCGFNDSHYFSRIFLKYTGMTPSEFRKSSRKA